MKSTGVIPDWCADEIRRAAVPHLSRVVSVAF